MGFFKRIAQKRNANLKGPFEGERLHPIAIAFSGVSTDRHPVGQQHRVRAKRKRHRAYLQRKKAARRASALQPASSKQRTKKESAPAAEASP
jgi:hypothetical protein